MSDHALEPAARAALDAYDLVVSDVQPLLDAFNCVFRVTDSTRRAYVLRLTSTRGCHGIDETRAELAWLAALAPEAEPIVPRPVPRRDGQFVGSVDRSLAPDHFQCVLFEWIPGAPPGQDADEPDAVAMGRAAGQLHEQARSFAPEPEHAHVRRYDRPFPYADDSFAFREPVRVLDDVFRRDVAPALVDAYDRAVARVTDEVRLLADGGACLIHNDLHPWNVLRMPEGRLAVIDFEDLMWGHPVQDLATTVYHLRALPAGVALETAFRRGYESVAPWPARDDAQLNAFVAGRGLILANTVLTAPDPEERAEAERVVPLIGERLRAWLA